MKVTSAWSISKDTTLNEYMIVSPDGWCAIGPIKTLELAQKTKELRMKNESYTLFEWPTYA